MCTRVRLYLVSVFVCICERARVFILPADNIVSFADRNRSAVNLPPSSRRFSQHDFSCARCVRVRVM